MIINELFDTIYSYDFISGADHGVSCITADFTTKHNENYQVWFGKHKNIIGQYIWVCVFSKENTRYQGGEDFNITNTGDSFAVFSTVVAIIKDFIKQNDPNLIKFDADIKEPSRVKLYHKLISKLKLPGYENTSSRHEYDVVFNITKIGFDELTESKQLNELFDKVYDYRVYTSNNDMSWKAIFKTDKDISYKFEAIAESTLDDEQGWYISFSRLGASVYKLFSITGDKDAFAVMATIMKIMEEFIHQVHPEIIGFTSHEPSRTKLYSKLVKKCEKFGYYATHNYYEWNNNETEFVLRKL